jgi:hypothetical protein
MWKRNAESGLSKTGRMGYYSRINDRTSSTHKEPYRRCGKGCYVEQSGSYLSKVTKKTDTGLLAPGARNYTSVNFHRPLLNTASAMRVSVVSAIKMA